MEIVIIPTLILFAAYMFASSSSLISEKAGVTNISIEGNMIMGAILYCVFMKTMDETSLESFSPLISVFLSGIFTSIFSWLFAIVVIKAYGNQIITGTGINLLAPAIATFIGYMVFGTADSAAISKPENMIGGFNEYIYPILFVLIAIFVILFIGFYLNKTKGGLIIRASGENPYALETSGISVNKIRMKVLLFTGLLSGIAGAIWVQTQSGGFRWTVLGAGFMAVGIVIFAQWKVSGIVIGSFIIALLSSISMNYLLIPILSNAQGILLLILRILPYSIPILVLIFMKSESSPKYLGKTFKKDQR